MTRSCKLLSCLAESKAWVTDPWLPHRSAVIGMVLHGEVVPAERNGEEEEEEEAKEEFSLLVQFILLCTHSG